MKKIGGTTDKRSGACVYFVQATVSEYLSICGEDFGSFDIQRKREYHKGYERLKADITTGTSLPPITLACNLNHVRECQQVFEDGSDYEILQYLTSTKCVSILDGLQRTFLLVDLAETGHIFPDDQVLLLEFRFERTVKDLIYRIIVLNSGQKPMTIRHQIDVLFGAMRKTMEERIADLEIFGEKDESRRTKSRKFSFERIVMGYQCYMTGSPEVEKENVVAQQLMEQTAFSKNEDSLNDEFNDFLLFFEKFCQLDDEICRIYLEVSDTVPTGTSWFGSENTINAFFAAIKVIASSGERRQRVLDAFAALLSVLSTASVGDDPLFLTKYAEIVRGFPSRKVNIGFATRKLLCNVFKEVFRERGEVSFATIWEQEAQ